MSTIKNETIDNQTLSEHQHVKIEVFTSPTCPHCPHAKKAVMNFVKGKDIKVIETSTATPNGSRRASSFGIRSVPTLFITGPNYPDRIAYAGVPSENGLKKMVAIASGKEQWKDGTNDAKKEGFFSRIAKLIGGNEDAKS